MYAIALFNGGGVLCDYVDKRYSKKYGKGRGFSTFIQRGYTLDSIAFTDAPEHVQPLL